MSLTQSGTQVHGTLGCATVTATATADTLLGHVTHGPGCSRQFVDSFGLRMSADGNSFTGTKTAYPSSAAWNGTRVR